MYFRCEDEKSQRDAMTPQSKLPYINDQKFNESPKKDLFGNLIMQLNDDSVDGDTLLEFQPSMESKTEFNPPFLPPKNVDREYTLVLDLDETLVHFQEDGKNGGRFLTRPYASSFLEVLSQHFELVIFTAAMQDYADFILDKIDKTQAISFRLYREHTTFSHNIYHKDLSKLGRDLSKTIIVDNNMQNFRLQPANGIYIKSWYNDESDEALARLCPILANIAKHQPDDIRLALKQVKQRFGKVTSPDINKTKALTHIR